VAVITGHIGVEVLPEAFEPVVVRAVRRKEVKLNSSESSQRAAGLITLVSSVVVVDEVNAPGVGVVMG
jgi:hypothetical protein